MPAESLQKMHRLRHAFFGAASYPHTVWSAAGEKQLYRYNNRPVNPLNGRIIYHYDATSSDEQESSTEDAKNRSTVFKVSSAAPAMRSICAFFCLLASMLV
jgi:hypothetical protein